VTAKIHSCHRNFQAVCWAVHSSVSRKG